MSDSPDAVVGEMNEERDGTCPVTGVTHRDPQGTSNRDWWPNRLNVSALHQNSPKSDPMGEEFDYAEEFKTLDLAAVKQDLSLIHISEPTRLGMISYAVFCLKKKKQKH